MTPLRPGGMPLWRSLEQIRRSKIDRQPGPEALLAWGSPRRRAKTRKTQSREHVPGHGYVSLLATVGWVW
jgi:hypothetical protein